MTEELLGQLTSRDILLGTAVHPGFWSRNPKYLHTLVSEFSLVIPEVAGKMDTTQPSRSTWDFTDMTTIVAMAKQYSLATRYHVALWWNQVPTWLWEITDSATLENEMMRRIAVIAREFGRQCYMVDVLNEGYTKDGNYVKSPWSRLPLYDELAFRAAKEWLPEKVGYNGVIAWSPGEKQRVLALAERGLVDWVGCQYHLPVLRQVGINTLLRDELPFWARLSKLGVNFGISEMDVAVKLPMSADDAKWQAETFSQIISAAASSNNCTEISTWGVSYNESWVPGYKPGWGNAVLFDANYQPTQAYETTVRRLEHG